MINHTPGPWNVVVKPDQDGWEDWNLYGVYDSDGKLIFERVVDFRREEEHAMSDARLAAASPEMYKTLCEARTMLQYADKGSHAYAALEVIDSAIAKAEGRDGDR